MFLVELLVCGILTLFFLFYFNRLFATLISYGVRAYTWHRHRVYVDVQALQFSLLAGRVFFRGFRYHGNNETILIHSGYITWRYWLRRVRDAECIRPVSRTAGDSQETGALPNADGLPCRLEASLQGLEWFIYNRSAAYDAVAASFEKGAPPRPADPQSVNEKEALGDAASTPVEDLIEDVRSATSPDGDDKQTRSESLSSAASPRAASLGRRLREHLAAAIGILATNDGASSEHSSASSGAPPTLTPLLMLYPIRLDCVKGAVVMGNKTTNSILTAHFEKASGEVDAARSRSVDQYKQVFNTQFSELVVHMRPNPDHVDPQASTAVQQQSRRTALPSFAQRLWRAVRRVLPVGKHPASTESQEQTMPATPEAQWTGLARYKVEVKEEEYDRWNAVEYAKFSTILQSPAASMSLYWDEPGLVSATTAPTRHKSAARDDINGDVPPDWGIDLTVHGGIVNYGPWADRQRAELQAAFFPRICTDAVPAEKLKVGQSRVSTVFKLRVELEADTVLRVPTREKSKDWKWRGRAGETNKKRAKDKSKKRSLRKKQDKGESGPEVRPFGWLDIKVKANSTIHYVSDMYARKDGYQTKLDLDLRAPECSTSVNHGTLVRAQSLKVSCDLSSPLQWNGRRTWTFGIVSGGPELFLLRDHVFLLSDLVDDWGSGPLTDYYTFTPFQYVVNLRLVDWRFYLNANDHNIVNSPADFDDNTFLAVHGASLSADLTVPMTAFRPSENEIPFEVQAQDGGIDLLTPLWNTQSTFLDSKAVAKLRDLTIGGRYNYHSSTESGLTDTLELDVYGATLTVELYGFLIRYILKLKDNYFGEDIHFRTLDEYQALHQKDGKVVAMESGDRHKKSNELDVILSIEAEDGAILLPANLYSAKDHIRLDLAQLHVDLRFTSYYMDLEVNFSPLSVSLGNSSDGNASPASSVSGTQAFVDGVTVYGHRLFGMPPAEPTYVCNWDFAVGAITGECSSDFLATLAAGARNFAFTFDDDENALPDTLAAALHDVTFLRAKVAPVRIWLHVEQQAVLLSCGTINVEFNDWAGQDTSAHLSASVPDLILSCVNAESASRHRNRPDLPVETHSYVRTSLALTMGQRKHAFSEQRRLQQQHLRYHDQRVHRTRFLIFDGRDREHSEIARGASGIEPAAMPYAPMPEPVDRSNWSLEPRSLTPSDDHLGEASLSNRSPSPATNAEYGVKASGSENGSVYARSSTYHFSRDTGLEPSRALGSPSLRSSSQPSMAVHGVTFSSSFIAPYFPLGSVDPDLGHVPALTSDANSASDPYQMSPEGVSAQTIDEASANTRLHISMRPGIQAFFQVEALHAAIALFARLQPKRPVDILDAYQANIISKILELTRDRVNKGKMMDLKLDIPCVHLRFLSTHPAQSELNPQKSVDEYTVRFGRLGVTARDRHPATPQLDEPRKGNFRAIHVQVDSIGFSVKENLEDYMQIQAAVRGDVDKLVLWFAEGAAISASVTFQDLELAMESKTIEYLAGLLDRTAAQAERLREAWADLKDHQERRLHYLISALVEHGTGITDPAFLTRPSYALRSASDHVRLTDSWKIVSRLRHVYRNLPTSTRDEVEFRCISGSGEVPADARGLVLENFNRWRSWELVNAKKSYAMQILYGAADEAPQGGGKDIKAVLALQNARLLIDPGPRESEISLQHIAADFSTESTQDFPRGIAFLQVHTKQVALRFNWELCELAERLIALHAARAADHSAQPVRSKQQTLDIGRTIHVVVGTDTGSVVLDGINIKSMSLSKGLKGTFLLCAQPSHRGHLLGNALVHCHAASTELVSHSRVLTITRVQSPSVHLSYNGQTENKRRVNVWKFAATCRDLSWSLEQELPSIIEVADSVITDEVAYVRRLVASMPTKSTSQAEPMAEDGSSFAGPTEDPADSTQPTTRARSTPEGLGGSSSGPADPTTVRHSRPAGATMEGVLTSAEQSAQPKSPNRFHVAMFMDSYHLRLAVLPSLTYVICGKVARSSMVMEPEGKSTFDFDLKEQSHRFEKGSGALARRSVSVLDLPPINGRVMSLSTDAETTLEVLATVESVKLDAAAIHDIYGTVNRPEMIDALNEIRHEIESTKARLDNVLATKARPVQEAPQAKPLIYVAHVTAAGLSVQASAPGKKGRSRTASMEFTLGTVQMSLANRLETSGPALDFVEAHLTLRHLGFRLVRLKDSLTEPCGNLVLGAQLRCSSKSNANGLSVRTYHVQSDGLNIELFAETASTVVDVVGHLQERIKDLDFSKEVQYLRKLRQPKRVVPFSNVDSDSSKYAGEGATALFDAVYSLDMNHVQVNWIVGLQSPDPPGQATDDLVLSFKRINLATRRENSARLSIEDLQLQMAPASQRKEERSMTSALLPEVVFNVTYLSTKQDRRLAFQAAGKLFDLRFSSQSVLAISRAQKSIATASGKFRAASASWGPMSTQSGESVSVSVLSNKRLASLLVDADFAGAVVYVQGRKVGEQRETPSGGRAPQHGRYGQFTPEDAAGSTTLKAPGVAFKIEYRDNGEDDPSLNAEVKVDASTNILFPTVVPLVMEISSSVQEVVSMSEDVSHAAATTSTTTRFLDDDTILTSDPSTILGRCRLNIGLRICQQEFSLSCQPIARVQATARFEEIYVTVNNVKESEHGHFFALSASFNKLQASVQHVYSREVTGTFDVESIVLSLMNSKHVSGTNGISTILKVGPMRSQINARQLQDFLLFRDIWVPSEVRNAPPPLPSPTAEQQPYLVQRYQQVAAAGAFPWDAAVAVEELKVQVDLGQALGKAAFNVSKLWVSTKKSSDWEQNLCLGFDRVSIDSDGRMSGFVALQDFRVRTMIKWHSSSSGVRETPLVQASLGFRQLRVKAAFDYQAFLVADITAFDFLMLNVRGDKGDRLVGTLDGGKVEGFCTSTSAAQGMALYQAFVRLGQEKKAAYESNLREIEKFLRRNSVLGANAPSPNPDAVTSTKTEDLFQGPLSLHTDVVVTIQEVNVGAFPSNFSDNQIFKLEALDAQARFGVGTREGKIHSRLGLTLGQLHVALAIIKRPQGTRSLTDVSVEDVIDSAKGARGDTILQVPKVVATMQTWQEPSSNHIDYIFTSSFEGKVDVGWNYSRINYVRDMWAAHSRTLAQRLGKPLPQSAVRITGGLQPDTAEAEGGGQRKITAVVDVPQSRYEYTALERPIIETPQLRELGDATPPLEWIGLHRDRLPNLTHQIVIVALLEVAREVEDAYGRILGSS